MSHSWKPTDETDPLELLRVDLTRDAFTELLAEIAELLYDYFCQSESKRDRSSTELEAPAPHSSETSNPL